MFCFTQEQLCIDTHSPRFAALGVIAVLTHGEDAQVVI